MKTTWIDLTDIELWSGHHGGTQRVVYGIAKNYYLSDQDNVRFFVYSASNDSFYETSFAPIYERVESLKDLQLLVNEQGSSLKQRIKNKVLHYAPLYIKNNKKLKANAKKIAKRALKATRAMNDIRAKYRQKYLKRSTAGQRSRKPIEFTSNETVLILGKPWDSPGLQRLLIRQRLSSDFKVVQVVYDLIISLYPHLHHPSLFKLYTQHMFDAVSLSDLMLPISASSDRDLRKFCDLLDLPAPNTSIIRLGDEIETSAEMTSQTLDGRVETEYILCVGTVENRKNHALLYQTYKLAKERSVPLPQLIVVGGAGWLADDVRYLITHDPEMKSKIVLLEGVNDAMLTELYKNCLFTVYPSLYEGWGLPVAESLVYGKVCVSSSASSMPEIAGDMLEYFSPNSTDECLAAIITMLDKDVRMGREKAINRNYKTTTWHDTYLQTKSRVNSL